MSTAFPRLFVDPPPAVSLLDETTKTMIAELAAGRTMLEKDREELTALERERDRLAARIEQLQQALIAAGVPLPPDAPPRR